MSNGRNGTSLVEQSLFYFVKKFFHDAENRYVLNITGHKLEIDIYIPEINLAIEYDGAYWHKNKLKKDIIKTELLNSAGMLVLHVREYGLPDLPDFFGDIIHLPYIKLNEKNYDYINFTLAYLSTLVQDPLQSEIRKFTVDENIYNDAIKYIYANRYSDVVAENLSDMCGIELWDTEKNYPLDPTHVGKYEWVPAVLICKNGREMELPRYYREFKSACLAAGCSCNRCCFIICPLLRWCNKRDDIPVSCKYVENMVWTIIKNKESLIGDDSFYTFIRWINYESDIGRKIYNKFLSYVPNSKKREDIAYFMGKSREQYRKEVSEGRLELSSIFYFLKEK